MKSLNGLSLFVSVLSVSSISFVIAGNAVADTIRIGGTGSALGTMSLIATEFSKKHPDHVVRILPSLGTSGGIKALQSQALEIAVTSRDIKPEEKAAGLNSVKYGTTAFVFISNRKNPDIKLTNDTIAAIYSGKQAAWSNGEPLRMVLRPREDSHTKYVEKMSPEIAAAVQSAHTKQGMIVAITDSDAADHVEKIPGAVGTSTLALVLSEERRLKVNPLNGVTPSTQTLLDGSYPMTSDMYAVTGSSPSDATKQFIQFLRSPQAAEILTRTGHKSP